MSIESITRKFLKDIDEEYVTWANDTPTWPLFFAGLSYEMRVKPGSDVAIVKKDHKIIFVGPVFDAIPFLQSRLL